MIRTDLALEAVSVAEADGALEGIIKEETVLSGVTVSRVKIINDEGVRLVGKPCGTYVTISAKSFAHTSVDNLQDALRIAAHEITVLLQDKLKTGVLVVGLGNSECTPDALGPKVAGRILVTRHMSEELSKILQIPDMARVSSIAPGVLGQTGVETAEIIKGLVEKINPSVVVVIDALAARSVERLGSTIQLSDTGISPGSGVGNHRRELSQATLGVPVVSIGIPTVVDAVTLANDILGSDCKPQNIVDTSMVVTPREIDVLIEHSANILAMAINKALHPRLETDDLHALTGG